MMKKLFTILISFVFLGITFSQSFASCEEFSRTSLVNGNISVSYLYAGGQSGSVSSSSVAHLVNTTESITSITKSVTTNFSSDYLILQGSLEFLTLGDSTTNNPNTPNVSNISAPVIYTPDGSNESYCEIIGFSSNSTSDIFLGLYNASNTALTPTLSSFSLTLKCHRNPNFPTTSSEYRIYWRLGFNLFTNNDVTLNSEYLIGSSFRGFALSVSNSCTNEQIISSLDSITDSVVDVGDKLDSIGDFIGDSSVSGSVLGAESFLSRVDGSYYGLEDFVQAPIDFLQSLISDSVCTPLSLPPILGTTITLPCFSDWLYNFNPAIFNLYKMVLYFYIAYLICSDLIRFIKNLRDPQNDNITIIDI